MKYLPWVVTLLILSALSVFQVLAQDGRVIEVVPGDTIKVVGREVAFDTVKVPTNTVLPRVFVLGGEPEAASIYQRSDGGFIVVLPITGEMRR